MQYRRIQNLLRKLFLRVRSFFSVNDWQKVQQTDILYLARDTDRHFLYNGFYFSPGIDSLRLILDDAGLTGTAMALPYSQKTTQAFGRVVKFNRSYFKAEACDILGSVLYNGRKKDFYKKRFWKKIIMISDVTTVIAIQPDKILVNVCKGAGVDIYDLQHGVIAGDAYYQKEYWEETNNLPSFLLWDKESLAALNSTLAPFATFSYVIGNPWLNRWRNITATDLWALEMDKKIKSFIQLGKRPILLTLQHGVNIIGINDTITEELINFIYQTTDKYTWFIRLHPAQKSGNTRKTVMEFLNKHFSKISEVVEWDIASEAPMPLLVKNVKVHITFNSASAIEAAKFGVTTGLLDRRESIMRQWFASYMEQGSIQMIPVGLQAMQQWLDSIEDTKGNSEEKLEDSSGLKLFTESLLTVRNKKG